MARNSKDFTYDAALLMKDAGLVGASAAATVSGSAKVISLGAGRADARVIVDVTACEVATGDEGYLILVQGSTSPTFASGNVNLGGVQLGDATVSLESADTPAATRREIAFANEVDGVLYPYVRLYTKVAGTVATGINYSGFMVQEF